MKQTDRKTRRRQYMARMASAKTANAPTWFGMKLKAAIDEAQKLAFGKEIREAMAKAKEARLRGEYQQSEDDEICAGPIEEQISNGEWTPLKHDLK